MSDGGAGWLREGAAAPARRRVGAEFARIKIKSTRPLEASMNKHVSVSKFSHVKEGDTGYQSGGLRDFFLYRDLGIADATGGQVIAHLVKANMPPSDGTGWH